MVHLLEILSYEMSDIVGRLKDFPNVLVKSPTIESKGAGLETSFHYLLAIWL